MSNRVAVITDMHFGVRNDSLFFQDYFAKFYKNIFWPVVDSNNIDTILILGDTFDKRKFINVNTGKFAHDIFFNVARQKNIDIHMLVGNHDAYFKNTIKINSPGLMFSDSENIKVIDSPRDITLKGVDICCLPWICEDNNKDSLSLINNSKANLCVGHLEVNGFYMYANNKSEGEGMLSVDKFNNFDLVLSGHYHHPSQIKNVRYLGSPYEMTWNDYGDDRGFHLLDLNSLKLEHIPNTYKIFSKIEYDETTHIKEDMVKDKIVKVIRNTSDSSFDFDQFIKDVNDFGVVSLRVIESDVVDYTDNSEDIDVEVMTTQDLLEEYIDRLDVSIDKDKLKIYIRNLYEESINDDGA